MADRDSPIYTIKRFRGENEPKGAKNFSLHKKDPRLASAKFSTSREDDEKDREDDEKCRGARPHFLQQTNRGFTDFSKIGD
jgi:hypothetical protein